MAYDLIDVESAKWNRDLIFHIFQTEEAEKISNLPLSRYGAEDKIIWRPTKDGNFTVKSTYHLECERIQRLIEESSTRVAAESMWKAIFNL